MYYDIYTIYTHYGSAKTGCTIAQLLLLSSYKFEFCLLIHYCIINFYTYKSLTLVLYSLCMLKNFSFLRTYIVKYTNKLCHGAWKPLPTVTEFSKSQNDQQFFSRTIKITTERDL